MMFEAGQVITHCSISTDLTDLTLVSEDSYWRLHWYHLTQVLSKVMMEMSVEVKSSRVLKRPFQLSTVLHLCSVEKI